MRVIIGKVRSFSSPALTDDLRFGGVLAPASGFASQRLRGCQCAAVDGAVTGNADRGRWMGFADAAQARGPILDGGIGNVAEAVGGGGFEEAAAVEDALGVPRSRSWGVPSLGRGVAGVWRRWGAVRRWRTVEQRHSRRRRGRCALSSLGGGLPRALVASAAGLAVCRAWKRRRPEGWVWAFRVGAARWGGAARGRAAAGAAGGPGGVLRPGGLGGPARRAR